MKLITLAQPIISVIILLGLFAFSSCLTVREAEGTSGNKESDLHMQQDTLRITGRLFVGGHEPFTVLVLDREDGGEVVLAGDDSMYKELWSYQNKIIQCKGIFVEDPLHGQSFYVTEYQILE
jgi:hypothetical protein